MTKYATMFFAAAFAGTVGAADSYQDLTRGNRDSFVAPQADGDFSGVQPAVGDSLDRYHGWADGNPDLFKGEPGNYAESEDPDIYGGLGGSPDISF